MGVVSYVNGNIMQTKYMHSLLNGEGDHVSYGYEVEVLGFACARYDFVKYAGRDYICTKFLLSNMGVASYINGGIMHTKYTHMHVFLLYWSTSGG